MGLGNLLRKRKGVEDEKCSSKLEPHAYVRILLNRTGLHFVDSDEVDKGDRVRYKPWPLMRCGALLLIGERRPRGAGDRQLANYAFSVLYQLLYVAWFIVCKRGERIERSLVLGSWLFQAFISMVGGD